MRFIMFFILMASLFPQPSLANVHLDFDGDGKSDLTLGSGTNFGNGIHQITWHVQRSRDGYFVASWGGANSNPGGYSDFYVPADYDGDGKTDLAIWRSPFTGGEQATFWILYSATSTYAAIPWGNAPGSSGTDEPAVADYDGDGKTDIAIVKHMVAGNFWWILQSRDGLRLESYGTGNDLPVVADYDGDQKADLAVVRVSTTNASITWYIQRSIDGNWMVRQLGNATNDRPALGDYDGDGKTDIAVVSRVGDFPTYNWRWIRSSDGVTGFQHWGAFGDYIVLGDYDGDGKYDQTIYRQNLNCMAPSYFWINGSSTGLQVIPWGSCFHSAPEFYIF
jgi:hypothetical protein